MRFNVSATGTRTRLPRGVSANSRSAGCKDIHNGYPRVRVSFLVWPSPFEFWWPMSARRLTGLEVVRVRTV